MNMFVSIVKNAFTVRSGTRHLNIFHNNLYLQLSFMAEERGAYRVLVGKPEGKRPLGRPRR